MSLEKALERDIVAFLDAEKEPAPKKMLVRHEDVVNLSSNYVADIKKHLKNNDLDRAKESFTELKEKYNEIPENHPEEKKRVFAEVQECYVLIYNYVTDKARTTILLQRYADAPDAVFDHSVKPVDLQAASRTTVTHMQEFEPMTVQSLQDTKGVPQKLPDFPAPQPVVVHVAAPPVYIAPQVVQAPPQPAPVPPLKLPDAPPVPVVLPTPTNPDDLITNTDRLFLLLLKRSQDIIETAPERSLGILGQIEKGLDKLSAQKQTMFTEKIRVLREKAKQQAVFLAFKKQFNDEYVVIANLGRLKNPAVGSRFAELLEHTTQFEIDNPSFAGAFSRRLDDLRQNVRIYTEQDIAEKVKSLLLRIKQASPGSAAQRFALDEYAIYVRELPDGPSKELLLAHMPKIQVLSPTDRSLATLQPALARLQRSRSRGDKAGVSAALFDIERAVSALPPSAHKEDLERSISTIRQAQAHLRPALPHRDEVLSLAVQPFVRRIKSARARSDQRELNLALQQLASFVDSLPEEPAKKTLATLLTKLRAS